MQKRFSGCPSGSFDFFDTMTMRDDHGELDLRIMPDVCVAKQGRDKLRGLQARCHRHGVMARGDGSDRTAEQRGGVRGGDGLLRQRQSGQLPPLIVDAAAYEYAAVAGSYVVDAAGLAAAKPDMLVMHPLPRVDEIATDVDADPRARYFEQMENGMFVRMALLALVLGADLSQL